MAQKLHVNPYYSSLEGRDSRNLDLYDLCVLCSLRVLLPDNVTIFGGTSLGMAAII